MYNNYKSNEIYYENDGNLPVDENWGSYQYVSLEDIVNNFMLIYQGDHELVNNLSRNKVLFHAKRGIQELNYDAVRETISLQLTVGDNLKFIFPPDFVSLVKVFLYKDGLKIPMVENIQKNFSTEYVQDEATFLVTFDENGQVIKAETSKLDYDRLRDLTQSIYLNPSSPYHNMYGWEYGGKWYFEGTTGGRTGLNTETANQNPTYSVDKIGGVINFNSDMALQSCIIEYVSDGMKYKSESINGNIVASREDSKIKIHKFFEEYLYSYIKYCILKNKLGVQEYIVNRVKRETVSLLRNARIRISDIKPDKLMMAMRGQNKMIK